MRSKTLLPLLLGIWLAVGLLPNSAHALRCGGRVIDAGSAKAEILNHCGEPTWVEKRPEKRVERGCVAGREYRRRHRRNNGHFQRDGHGRTYDACVYYVDVEEWFYNFGRSRFTQTLIFENNRLVEIIDGGYGY